MSAPKTFYWYSLSHLFPHLLTPTHTHNHLLVRRWCPGRVISWLHSLSGNKKRSCQHTWKESMEGEREKRREKDVRQTLLKNSLLLPVSCSRYPSNAALLLKVQQRFINLFLRELGWWVRECHTSVWGELGTDVAWFDLPEIKQVGALWVGVDEGMIRGDVCSISA